MDRQALTLEWVVYSRRAWVEGRLVDPQVLPCMAVARHRKAQIMAVVASKDITGAVDMEVGGWVRKDQVGSLAGVKRRFTWVTWIRR